MKRLFLLTLTFIMCSCVSTKKHNDMKIRLLDNLTSCEIKLFKAKDSIENMSRLKDDCEERCNSYVDTLKLCKNRESDLRRHMRETCFK